jgi:signal transduction histidine kinase
MSQKLGAQATDQSGAALRVVLADDASDVRLLLRRSLESDGSVEVIGEASNGAEAVRLVESAKPDAVLLDLAMPVMDGLRAIPEIRRSSPKTEIVVLSAFNASKMEERAYEAGAAAFLSKASSPDAILGTLRDVSRRTRGTVRRGLTARAGRPRAERVPARQTPFVPADESEDDLLGVLCHQLGNQLTVIQGFSEMLLDGIGGTLPPDSARQFAEAIVRNAKQMSDLLATVSEVRELDQGVLQFQMVDVDVSALILDAAGALKALLGDRLLTLDLAEEAVVAADPVRIGQIFTHLVAHVAERTAGETSVVVAVTAGANQVELSVTFDGPGVPPEQRGQLFEKTGMGLYLSRGLARAHGGDLVVLPRGSGFRFVLRLPRPARAIAS